MRRYADSTSVPIERSRGELSTMLRNRYGAKGVMVGENDSKVLVEFIFESRRIRFVMTFPGSGAVFTTPRGRRVRDQKSAAFQEERRLWRALVLRIKTKLIEVVEQNISVDEAFLPYIVMPDGRTMFEIAHDKIEQAYLTGQMPDDFLKLPGMGETH
jgi:hypothetical protein